MPVLPGDITRVDVIGDMGGTNLIVNTYQFRYESGTVATDSEFVTDMLELLRALYDAAKSLWTAVVVFRRIRAYNLTAGTLLGEADFSTPVTGTAGGEQGAFQSAGLISFKTTLSRVVMRKYLPIAEASIGTSSNLIPASVTLLQAFGSALLPPMVATSGRTYRFGYLSGKAGGFIAPTSRTVSGTVVTQRRRRPGVGR